MPVIPCDCEAGEELIRLYKEGADISNGIRWNTAPSKCMRCKDTGLLPSHYCDCARGQIRRKIDVCKDTNIYWPDTGCDCYWGVRPGCYINYTEEEKEAWAQHEKGIIAPKTLRIILTKFTKGRIQIDE